MSEASYYDTLNIARNSTDSEIKKSYRSLALKWHPDKNQDNTDEANSHFEAVAEAYDVLSDQGKKAVYDQFGYEGLRDGVPDQNGETTGYIYEGNSQQIFEKFFGSNNPFASFGNDSAPFSSKLTKPGPKKGKPQVHPLVCTLKELYMGSTRTFAITRKRFTGEGELVDDEKVFSVAIKKGWKRGTKIVFAEQGDEAPNTIASDVVLVIEESSENESYVRDGDNLIYTYTLNLTEALTDVSLMIPTLDDRRISIACPEVVSPFYAKTVVGEGMPLSKADGDKVKGDMIIRFHILFPKYLNQKKREQIKSTLAGENWQN